MKASYRWLKELSGVDASASEMAARLTALGLEVEDTERFGFGLDHVVIAEVRAVDRVEGKDKLSLVTVFDGDGERKVICGAPNVPGPGGRVVLAKPGATLPGGMTIAERDVGGVRSAGMLCSETELEIGTSGGGILVLQNVDPGRPGQLASEALGLEDHVFEIGLTPNRPDCLGHIGLAREVALAWGAPFRVPSPGYPSRFVSTPSGESTDDELALLDGPEVPSIDTLTLVDARPGVPMRVPVRLLAPERCPRYAAGIVQGVNAVPSPFWLRYRLHVLGLRSIDAVVDATNLVLFEIGHPIHAFDLARVRGPEIVVRLATEGETMATLDGVTRTFTADDLLICDGGGPVAVAGVMGGADSEIRAETRDVLIEVAYFDPRSIRRTSRRLGLHTDSSHRFERGVDPNAVPWAMRRAVTLLCTLAGGAAVPNVRDAYPEPIRARSIELAPTRVGAFLGVAVEEAKVRDHLEAVGCSISPALDGGWRVSAPTHRPDLGRPEDLIEEVARAMGYDAIPTELPRLKPSGRGAAEHLRAARRLREAAAATGLLEAVNYSFVSKADLAHARVPTDGVELLNPLSEERSVMRTSLLPGMLAALARALRHQARSAALFELARVFERAPGERLPKERYELGIALAGERVEHVGAQGDYDYFDVKGALSSVLEAAFGLAMETRPPTSVDPSLHPRRSADVYLVGLDAPVGQVGEVHPDITEGLGMDRRAMFARVALEPLLAAIRARGDAKSSGLPRFPSSSRDVALRVPRAMPAADVEAALRASGEPLMERVELFDVYEGAALEGDKSLAYRIIYRDPDATLTDRRVEEAHRRVVGAATAALGVSVRA